MKPYIGPGLMFRILRYFSKFQKKGKLSNSVERCKRATEVSLESFGYSDGRTAVNFIGNKNFSWIYSICRIESDRITNIKSRRIAEREARRARRREKRRIEASVKDHYEGMSSDDEMIPSDALRFQADKGAHGEFFFSLLI